MLNLILLETNLGRQTRLIGRWVKLYNYENSNDYLDYINNTQKRIIVCLKNIQSKKLKSIYEKVLTVNE